MDTDAAALLDLLSSHAPHDEAERAGLTKLRGFVETAAAPFDRATPEGHVTGSAMVLDPAGRALLLFHARLGLWLQPGGHCEPGESAFDAALREATEESGLTDLARVDPPWGPVLDVDVHPIPASEKRREPAHFHHDVCFLLRTERPEQARIDPDESHALRWLGPDELLSLPLDPATRRRLAKAFALARR